MEETKFVFIQTQVGETRSHSNVCTTDSFVNAPLPHKCGVPQSLERNSYAAEKNFVVRPTPSKPFPFPGIFADACSYPTSQRS
jgi:hypothetical protein